jgi:hypothetical protein
MRFEHSCFISYRRGQEELTRTFVTGLQRALSNYLEPWLDETVFLDEGRLTGGDYLETRIADALCKSVCMVLVFTPRYFSPEHLYCTREFLAMEEIERSRFQIANREPRNQDKSFIIPVVFRGAELIPSEVRRRGRFSYDFSRYTLLETDISRNEGYVGSIQEIAQRVHELHSEFRNYDDPFAANAFELPSEDEARGWLRQNGELRNAEDIASGFPGRGGSQ